MQFPVIWGKSRRVRMDLKPSRLVSSPHDLLTTTRVQKLVDKKEKEKDQMTVTQAAAGKRIPFSTEGEFYGLDV